MKKGKEEPVCPLHLLFAAVADRLRSFGFLGLFPATRQACADTG